MNRLVWLPALILLAIMATGCQSTKFPSPKWPDFAMFKKKDKDLAPPSEHFDVAEQTQLAGSQAGERKPTEIPGEAPAGTVKSPADLAKPTAPMVAGKSGSSSTPESSTKPGSAPPGTQPIRKPYEMARSSAEGVKQTAGTLASDIEKSSQAAAGQVTRNANEVVGQFQQQGRDLANAANNSLNQAANDLNQKANNALNAIAPASQSGNPVSAGGDFAFSKPTGNAPGSSAPPPWSSPAAPQYNAQVATPKPTTPINSAPAAVDPLKSLAAGAALTPSSQSPSNPSPSGFNPNPVASAERQLQPINQQTVNQNLGASAANQAASNPASTADSPQFQLPVAQPPAFVANRTSAPAASSPAAPFNNTPPASSPQFSPQAMAPMASAQPARQPMAANPAPQAGGNKYPSTGFNSFVASGSNPSAAPAAPLGNSAFNAPAATTPNTGAQSASVNSAWQNQASPIAASSNTSEAAATRPVSHNAELPAELMQRSGGYAPGSIGGSSSGETLWR